VWRRSLLKTMLRNETYLGVKYFNKMRVIRQYANPIYHVKHSTKKNVKRVREDWSGSTSPRSFRRSFSTAYRSFNIYARRSNGASHPS
jgi:hypothetical protein